MQAPGVHPGAFFFFFVGGLETSGLGFRVLGFRASGF